MILDPKREYRETAVRSASPTGLVIMLYETAIEDLRRIAAAIAVSDIQRRTDETHHLLQVLNQLQGSLDMERGGDVAANLDRYYNLVRSQLLQADVQNSAQPINNLLNQFLSLHQAWMEVERAAPPSAQTSSSSAPPRASSAPAAKDEASSPAAVSEPVDWSA